MQFQFKPSGMPDQAHIKLEDDKLAMHLPPKFKALILVFSV